MQLRDLLEKDKPTKIIWRVRLSGEEEEFLDTMAGVAYWDGSELQSVDGDTYSLEEEIVDFRQSSQELVYWTSIEEG